MDKTFLLLFVRFTFKEISVHNEKREIRAILELITKITHKHPELTETVQEIFQHHEMDLVSIRRLSKNATPA